MSSDADRRAKGAMRSGYQTVMDPETLRVKQEAAKEEEERQLEEEKDVHAYASLKGHPGWELIKKDFQRTIDSYRSGRPIQTAISAGKSVEEIGQLTMVSNAVADELEHHVQTVEGAALALEENGPKRKRL